MSQSRYDTSGKLRQDLNLVSGHFVVTQTETLLTNLLDNVIFTDEFYVNNATGNLAVNDLYGTTSYINISDYLSLAITALSFNTYGFYDANDNPVSYGSVSAGTSILPIPDSATTFRYSCKLTEKITTSVFPIINNYNISLSDEVATKDTAQVVENAAQISYIRDRVPVTAITRDLSSGLFYGFSVPDIKFKYEITFSAKITTFGDFRLSYGKTAYNGSYLLVDDTNMYVYRYTTAENLIATLPHGLTFSDFVNVNIKVGYFKAIIILTTTAGSYVSDEIEWYGARENVLMVVPSGSTAILTDCVLTWCSTYLNKSIWWFGDSYLDTYPNNLSELGYTNAMFDGFSGRTSADAIISLQRGLTYSKPKTIVWGLGMNDPDNGSINSDWLTAVNTLISTCEDNNIELIFLTIPNTPIVDNSYKNAHIKSSGYQYLDIADAVGASNQGSSWYSGLLNVDQKHPSTTTGRMVIASYIISQFPQLRNEI